MHLNIYVYAGYKCPCSYSDQTSLIHTSICQRPASDLLQKWKVTWLALFLVLLKKDCQVKLWQFKCDVWYWLLSSRDCKRCFSHFIQDLTIDLHYRLKVSLLSPVLPGKEISGTNCCTAAQGRCSCGASGCVTSMPTNWMTTAQCVRDSCNYCN